MDLRNCSLEECNQLAEWHQKEARIAKQSIPQLVSQHYQHLLFIETSPLKWIPIDAKTVPHKKNTFIDFIINSILHEKQWIKHFQRNIKAELIKRSTQRDPIQLVMSLYPEHQSSINLILALMLLNKFSAKECWHYLIHLTMDSDCSIEKLMNLLQWALYFYPNHDNSIYNLYSPHSEFIVLECQPFELEISIKSDFKLLCTDPTILLSCLDQIKSNLCTNTMKIKHITIESLLDCIQFEVLRLLADSIDEFDLFESKNAIEDWMVFISALESVFTFINVSNFYSLLNSKIVKWSKSLNDHDLFKLYFLEPFSRNLIQLPSIPVYNSCNKEPWPFDLVNPCRLPYLPANASLNGFYNFTSATFIQDSDYTVTTWSEFTKIPPPPMIQQDIIKPSNSFTKSMSLDKVVFQKPSLFKFAKSMFD